MKIIIINMHPSLSEQLVIAFKAKDVHYDIYPTQLIEKISREELGKYICFKENPHPYGWYRKFEKRRF